MIIARACRYFATVSWTDSNIGRVLDAFEATNFAKGNDYVLAVWGDHGWREDAHMKSKHVLYIYLLDI
jgi:arylsulfatase A-like enzyme